MDASGAPVAFPVGTVVAFKSGDKAHIILCSAADLRSLRRFWDLKSTGGSRVLPVVRSRLTPGIETSPPP